MGNWEGAGKGAAGGAMAGAAFGPWGAAIGGVAGGAIGYFSGGESGEEKKSRQMLEDYYRRVQGRQPIQMDPTQYGATSQDVRARQIGLTDQLQSISNGTGPSLATEQLKQATDRNSAQQMSFANSGRGGPMAASRAMNNTARLGAVAAQDASVARMAEANQARQLLGLNLHGIRGSDEEMSRFNASQGNEMNQANMWSRLKQQGMNDEAAFNIINQLRGQNTATNGRPDLSDQILAGGASMYAQYQSQKAASAAAAAKQS